MFAIPVTTVCKPINGTTEFFQTGCHQADSQGKVGLVNAIFSNPTCSGEPTHVGTFSDAPMCSMDINNYFRNGPETISPHCTAEMNPVATEKPGMISAFYGNDHTCTSLPYYTNMLAGVCTLSMDTNPHSGRPPSYNYQIVDWCRGSKAKMTIYADPACKRPLHTGTMDLSKVVPNFGKCGGDGRGGFTKNWCAEPKKK